MKMTFRWYGESDPVKLEYIRQIPGMYGIVSAIYDVPVGEVEPDEVGAAAAVRPQGGLLERPRALFVPASAPFRHVAQQSEGVHAEVAAEQCPRDREGGVRTPAVQVGVDGVLDGHDGGSRPPGDVHAVLGDGSVQPRQDVSEPSGVTQPSEDLRLRSMK
mgnify:CR=1 FL=1